MSILTVTELENTVIARFRDQLISSKTKTIRSHRSTCKCLAWNSTGSRLASCSSDRTIKVYNAERPDSKNATELKGHVGCVSNLGWDPSHSDRLASVSSDKTVRLWDYRNSRCISDYKCAQEPTKVCWSPDGRCIAVCFNSNSVSFLDARQLKPYRELKSAYKIKDVCWNNSLQLIFSALNDGKMQLHQWSSLEPILEKNADLMGLVGIKADPRGKYVATAGKGSFINFYSTHSLELSHSISRIDSVCSSFDFSFDGSLIAIAAKERQIDVALVDSGKQVHKIALNNIPISVAWHPNKFYLAFCEDNVNGSLSVLGYKV